MLDARWLAENAEEVKDHLRRRQADDALLETVDRVVALGASRSALIHERDELRAERNRLSKEIGELYKGGKREEAEALKARVTAGNERTARIEEELREVEEEQGGLLMRIPNLLDPEVPPGKDESKNVEVRRVGTPRTFDFEPQPHVEVGERLGILDFERAARLSGARFWVLRGAGARLERALLNFFLDLHVGEHGYTEVMVPYIVPRSALEGTGQLPKFEEDLFRLDAQVNGQDAFLIPTAEVPVTNLHREEILEEAQLPVRYACFTPCFRAEAGSAGREVRGLIRVHQFHKVELVWIVRPEDSEEAHRQLLGHAEEGLKRLELPYRVELLCGGDTSFAAAKCWDLEVWMPSQGAYREVSSVSNFHDFQARRMAMRYRPEADGGKKAKTRHPHTLNGSGLALGRTMVALLENFQQADGSVVLPDALRPYMGGAQVLRPG